MRRTGTGIGTALRFEAPALAPMARRQSSDAIERDELRAEARRLGRSEGLAAARAEVEAAIAAQDAARLRLEHAAAALEAATADLDRRDAVQLRTLEREVVRFAAALAEEIVGAELRAVDEPVLGAIERSIGLVPDRGDLVVRVHPDDTAAATDAIAATCSSAMRSVITVADPTIERGGCILEVGTCRVDAQIGPALSRLSVVLGTGSSQDLAELLAR
ncbi:MAG: FliH/SctL family protein [Acidimicrobiia bacterium]